MNAYQPVNISVTVQLSELGGWRACMLLWLLSFCLLKKLLGAVMNVADLEC